MKKIFVVFVMLICLGVFSIAQDSNNGYAPGIIMEWSKTMADNAMVPENYTLEGEGVGTLSPSPDRVEPLDTTMTRFRLSWDSGEMIHAKDLVLILENITDTVGNPPDSASQYILIEGGGIGNLPTIRRIEVVAN